MPPPILAAAQALTGPPGLDIPANTDLVLHSACHLFHEGEWGHGLRDLVDLDAMLRGFEVDSSFWQSLLARAQTLNIGRPLLLRAGLLPALAGYAECHRQLPATPPSWQRAVMRYLFDAGLASAHQHLPRPTGWPCRAYLLYSRTLPAQVLVPAAATSAPTSQTTATGEG